MQYFDSYVKCNLIVINSGRMAIFVNWTDERRLLGKVAILIAHLHRNFLLQFLFAM